MSKKYILVDGSGYIFRAFYALPPMTRSDGLPTGAVYGFCSMLMRLLASLDGDETVVVVFDAARKNWRNEIYPEYKANRADPPEELVPQFAYIRKAVEAFGLPSVEMVGFEADDLIATYAKMALEEGAGATVYSSDKDLMQLLRPGVRMFDPIKSRAVDDAAVMDKFGVAPSRVVDVQALVGDSVDNIPGVKGIGPKTAAELIGKFGGLEDLLARAAEIPQDKRRQMILDGAGSARLSYELARLRDDVPAPPLSGFVFGGPDKPRLARFFEEMEFKSLVPKVYAVSDKAARASSLAAGASPPPVNGVGERPRPRVKQVEKRYSLVTDIAALAGWLAKCGEGGIFAIDTETTGLDALHAGIVGFSLAVDEGVACYVPLAHVGEASPDMFSGAPAAPSQIPVSEAMSALKPLLEDPKVKKIGHNVKYDMHVFRRYGIRLDGVEDTMVMSYVLDGVKNLHNMDDLARIHLEYATVRFGDVVGAEKEFARVPLEKALGYAAEDADITLRLYNIFRARLDAEDKAGIYDNVDRPLIPVLCDMEEWGVLVDLAALKDLSAELAGGMAGVAERVYALAGVEFNINSPKQVGEVLFGKLGLPDKKRSSTDSDILGDLADMGHDIAAEILKWRELAKIKGTYADAIPGQVSPRDGRVHTNFFQAGTSTSRLSSSDPNLQNIPVRTPLGARIRRAFVAAPGFRILSADYSQIELRILASVASVAGLKRLFAEGADIHKATASRVFGVPLADVTPELRSRAKAVNFGIIYGISSFGLARNTGLSRPEAQAVIDSYFRAFPEILEYMERTKAFAHENGFIRTFMGRKCFIYGINSPKARLAAERAAINAPIQGSNADMIKVAMERIAGIVAQGGLSDSIRMLIQVHDELVFEVEDGMVDEASRMIKAEMEAAAPLDGVKVVADIGVADNWRDAH
ncbi:MAG: DNA polymerase I [Rickettsiales bacterium]|jgi:DNA polymerase-1|nr:DNA polymerase I [Rickettsiales bacterium]